MAAVGPLSPVTHAGQGSCDLSLCIRLEKLDGAPESPSRRCVSQGCRGSDKHLHGQVLLHGKCFFRQSYDARFIDAWIWLSGLCPRYLSGCSLETDLPLGETLPARSEWDPGVPTWPVLGLGCWDQSDLTPAT